MDNTIEALYDSYLNIATGSETGDETKEGADDNIYEATSYFFLERLFQAFPFEEGDHLADFGCGKGRVLFMASNHSCRRVTGYENNDARFEILKANVARYQQKHGAQTVFNIQKIDAQSAEIDDSVNKFFFFEPFSIDIYARVIQNIKKSLDRRKRDATIFLYLPEESTLEYWDSVGGFHREIYVESTLYYTNEALVTMPQFAFYANYPMSDAADPYFLLY